MAASDLINLSGLIDGAKCFTLVRQHRWPACRYEQFPFKPLLQIGPLHTPASQIPHVREMRWPSRVWS